MNEINKEYVAEVKSLFPIMRKSERTYLNKLLSDVEDFCEETNTTSKEALYNHYGKPEEVVSNYISALDREVLIKHINLTKYIKLAVAGLLIAITVATAIWGIYVYRLNRIAQNAEVVLLEPSIQYYN